MCTLLHFRSGNARRDAKNWCGNLMGVMGDGEEKVRMFEWNAAVMIYKYKVIISQCNILPGFDCLLIQTSLSSACCTLLALTFGQNCNI